MSTSISTPSSLATFQQPHASTSKLPHVTLSPVEGGEGNYAVAAVQGDGVWTYDLRTMRPITSYTVPPSTLFSSPPISFHYKGRGKDKAKADEGDGMDVDTDVEAALVDQRITAVALEKGEGVSKDTARRVVWIWTGEDEDRQSVTVAEPVTGLHRISHPTHPIFIVHSASSFSLVSPDEGKSQHLKVGAKTASTAPILASQVTTSLPEHSRCLVVDAEGCWTLVSVENGVAEKVREGSLTDDKRRFVSASISKDGVITATDSKNQLVSKHMSEASSSSFPTLVHPISSPLSISLPTFGKPLAVLPTLHPVPSILLTVASSSVPALLSKAAITSASSNTTISHLALLGNVSPNVLIVGIVLHHSMEDGGRSVLYSCEVTIPQKGIGLNALLGSQVRTGEYITLPITSDAQGTGVDRQAGARDKCLSEITAALGKGDTKTATSRLNDLLSGQDAVLPERFVTDLVNVVFGTALPDLGKEVEGESKKRGPYASKMITTLLQRGVVNDEMIKGGVVSSALLPLSDWENIFIALPLLRTIPSSSLVSLVKASLRTPSVAGTPSPETVLEAILALPPPPPTYRVELKRGLGVEDATSVLEVLTRWSETWVASSSKGLQWEIGQTLPAETETESSIPSLEAVITHSSLLLDSHTPLFLGHPASYPILTRMQAALEPLLHMQADYRSLRAPLDAVLTLSKRAERTREEQQRKNEVQQGAYGRRSKVQAQAQGQAQNKQAEVMAKTMGDGKVGKWKVEDFVF